MSWYDTYTINGKEFGMGNIGYDGGLSLILSPRQIIEAGDQLQEILDWFTVNADEFELVHSWRDHGYDKEYFSQADLFKIFNSKFATEHDKEMLIAEPVRNREPRLKPARRTQPGYVYLIINSEGHYKIGKAKNAEDRITTLGVVLPFPVTPVHTIKTDDMTGLERELHTRFDSKRLAGEWFALTQEDVEYIKSL